MPTFRTSLHRLGRPAACALAALLALALIAPAAAGAKSWTPDPAGYRAYEQSNVPDLPDHGLIAFARVG